MKKLRFTFNSGTALRQAFAQDFIIRGGMCGVLLCAADENTRTHLTNKMEALDAKADKLFGEIENSKIPLVAVFKRYQEIRELWDELETIHKRASHGWEIEYK